MPALSASLRTQLGSATARRLTAKGQVPAVLYGIPDAPIHLVVKAKDLQSALKKYYSGTGLLTLTVEGKGDFSVVIHEIQHHPWKGHIRHVDFFAVSPSRIIKQSVEVLPDEGVAVRGVRLLRRKLLLKGPADKLPHTVRIPLTHLNEGQSILVRDLRMPEGIQVLDPPGEIVAVRQ
ncbi:MAG: 50S ribosomal protein L25 [bacterium JZ-2024 1]